MGKKKKNRKIPIFLNVNEMTIRETGITLDSMEAHLSRSLIEYISSVNTRVFTLKELDSLCSDICEKLLNYDNDRLYCSILFIHTSSDSDYKKEFITFIRNMYKDKLEENKINEIVEKFSNSIELYRKVIDRTIMSDENINQKVANYSYSIYSEAHEIYNKLNDINRNSDLFNLNKKYTLDMRDKDKRENGYDCNLIDKLNSLTMVESNDENENNLFDDEELNAILDTSSDETLANLLVKLDDEEFNKMANDIILDNKDEIILSDL